MECLAAVEARDDLARRLAEAYDKELLKELATRVRLRVEAWTWAGFCLLAFKARFGVEVARRLEMRVATVFVARSKVQRVLRKEVARLEGASRRSPPLWNGSSDMGVCPPAESLERLLGEVLTDPERECIEAHVEGCTACQETLHRLAQSAPGPAPAHLQSALSEPAVGEATAEADAFLEALKQKVVSSGSDGRPGWQPSESESAGLPEVAGYEILEELGRGAVGVVYRARHRVLNRLVALKMILAGPHLSPEARRRLRVEAQAIARLRHPNIVQIHEVGEQAGCPYLALELVEGENLAGWVAGVARPAAEAARTVATLAGAVDYAHRQGVIHRDLKPANVLMAADGTAKITDFGLAKILPGPGVAEERMTQSGMILGTPSYIAPEQARGQAKGAGPGVDIYSLGAILYELLTGRPPFQGISPMETLLQAAHQEPVPVTRLVPRVPRDLDTICLKCLEKDPAKRYATAGEVADDLNRFLNHEPIRARPVGRLERGLRWVRRRPAPAALLAGSLLLAMSLVGGGLWLVRQRTEAARIVAQELREVARLQQEFSWAEAGAELERAKDRLGYSAPADLHQRLDQARRDLVLLTRLDAIRLTRATVVEGRFNVAAERRFNQARADREYEEAFRKAGLGAIQHDAEGMAVRVKASAVRGALVAALDDWAVCAVDKGRQAWLLEVTRRADPDAWRDRVRDPVAWGDPAALTELTRTTAVAERSVPFLVALGERLQAIGGDATGFLARVQPAHPADFWASFTLGKALHDKGELEEGVGYYQKALAIRPDAVAAYINIGHARFLRYRLEENDGAMENYRQALRIDPRSAPAHSNLGLAFKAKGLLNDAIEHYKAALQLDSELAPTQFNLGEALAIRGELNGAIDHYRQALRIDPNCARAHYLLGVGLLAKSRLDEANGNYQKAIRVAPKDVKAHDRIHGLAQDDALDHYFQAILFDPTWAPAYNDLGSIPREKGRLDEVIDHYQQALRSDPDLALAHAALGQALLAQGRIREALAATRRSLGLPSEGNRYWRANLTRQLERCERLMALEGRLPAVLQGKDRPADSTECIQFADLCRIRRQYAAAAKLFSDALATRAQLPDDMRAGFRYNAPIVAVLAGSGRGEGGANLSEAERARWRKQAREWLQADLAAWSKNLDSSPAADRTLITKILTHWRTDPDLAGLRDPDAVNNLPEAERQECRKLLSDLDTLLNRAKSLK